MATTMLSPKQEIEAWVAALTAYDANDFDSALASFTSIAHTSKILFNMGVISATLGEHTRAVETYQRAVALDQYLAVAYFQQGVSNFLMGDFEEALANFNDTLLYLRGNKWIDYAQLGLKFKLYSCEVLFNRGLCYIYLQQKEAGLQDLRFAAEEKLVPDHEVIDEAIKEQAEGYTVFSIPVGVVYRPNEAKVKNLKRQDYLGRPRLVAQYQNPQQQQQQIQPSTSTPEARRSATLAALAIDDRPGEKRSFGATNLVKAELRSRGSRQQSEPPLHRNIFPPTPPPESVEPERHDSAVGVNGGVGGAGRRLSSGTTASTPGIQQQQQQPRQHQKPARLELGVAAFDHRRSQQQQQQQDQQKQQQHHSQQAYHPSDPKARLGTKRSESERPALRRELSNSSMRSGASTSRTLVDETSSQNAYPHRPLSYREGPHHLSSAASSTLSPLSQGARSSSRYSGGVEGDSMDSYSGNSDKPLPNIRPTTGLSSSHKRSRSSAAQTILSSTSGGVTTISEEEEEDDENDSGDNRARPRASVAPTYISDQTEDADDLASPSAIDESELLAFEIVGPYHHNRKLQQQQQQAGRRASAASSVASRSSRSRYQSSSTPTAAPVPAVPVQAQAKPELRKIRIKVHAEDIRHVLVAPTISYEELVATIRAKIGASSAGAGTGSIKLKIKDEEGDLVVMGDQEDWEMCVAGVRAAVMRQEGGGEVLGKAEVWVVEV